jgi:metal-sulfur cluster biosynthetic enzyme
MSAALIDQTVLMNALRQVIDPELGVNIVDLGLIYDIEIAGSEIKVVMTVTTPGCPMQDSLKWGVHSALMSLGAVEAVDVQIVFEPPWSPARIAAGVRDAMGIS